MRTKQTSAAAALLQRQAVAVAAGSSASVSDRLLNVYEVAKVFDCSDRHIRKLLASQRFPAPVRLGRSIKWRASDIDEFIRLGCPSLEQFEAARAAGTDHE